MEQNGITNVSSQFLETCGITASPESSSNSVWQTDHTSADAQERFASVDSILQSYITGFSSTDDIIGLPPRARVDAILVMSLGIAKQKLLKTCDAQAKPDVKRQLATLFWGHSQFISVPESFSNPCGIRSSALDYVLWYGEAADLETNLVVLRVDEAMGSAVEERYYSAALAAISMIHHNRAKRPIIQDTYGLVTDGLKWTFFHVNKEHEYSSLTLNWLEGDEQAIVHLVDKIMDQAVTVKMKCEKTELARYEWEKIATKWDLPQHKYSEEEEDIYPEETDSDDISPPNTPHLTPYFTKHHREAEWLADLRKGIYDILECVRHGESVDEQLEDLVNTTSEKAEADEEPPSDHGRKHSESVAVTDIDPSRVMNMFDLRHQPKPTNNWRLEPWEVRNVSSRLETTLEQIKLVYGDAYVNQAASRLMVDAIFLDVLTSIKSSSSRKALRMALAINISYKLPTRDWGSVVEKLVEGRMDYTLRYGNPKEAETNLVVVEPSHRCYFSAARYQAISYMALIQHARNKAGRAKTPIYGVTTDIMDWDFIRMDASGNFCWGENQGSQIISLLHKIISEALTLPTASHEKMAEEVADSDGSGTTV
ncbi:uncharacterized protein APUU_31632A [Aspergillus puulaauensis]|uniref:Uncharacterized protein n=1 Tax=Aspergillus puulaauensis TaxID=1220207 RepID=A0A7R7XKY9_9EURO|nr:uncharacterized protein APUU_31632A [Aspergillus puulaauensis]BCS23407.1 hypothetical protein APUU_31632A [Aspergillus puulaauensis]